MWSFERTQKAANVSERSARQVSRACKSTQRINKEVFAECNRTAGKKRLHQRKNQIAKRAAKTTAN